MIDEAKLDRDIERAVAASRASDTNLWIAALYAYRVVGQYIPEATARIADRAGRTVSAVENWAHAYEAYRNMRIGVDSEAVRTVRNIRKSLTVSHFAEVWGAQNKYDFPTPAAESYLAQMVVYKAEDKPHSVIALRQEIDADMRPDGGQPVLVTWVSQRDTFRSRLVSALTWRDVPPEVNELVRRILDLLEG